MVKKKSSKVNQSGFGIVNMVFVIAVVIFIILAAYVLLTKHTIQTSRELTSPNSSQGITERNNISYGSDSSQQFDSFMPNGDKTETPAVIFVHGGSWDSGDKSGLDQEAGAVAAIGWAGFSINYRLKGFPTEPEDVLSAIEYIRNHAAEYNVNPDKIAVLGTSAGGNLAAEAVTEAKSRLGHTSGVAALVTWSGPMDLRISGIKTEPPSVAKIVEKYMQCSPAACPTTYALASPITHVAADDPPILVINSTEEVVPLTQAQTMVKTLNSVGVTAQLDAIPGNRHAMAYASDAFVPSINFLSKFLGPVNGSIPHVSAYSKNL